MFSALLGLLFALSGVREGILRRNFALTGLRRPPLFRLRLGTRLAADLLALLAPGTLTAPRLHLRSAPALAALRSGPTLLLTAHVGNWEAQASAWGRLGVPLLGAARPLASARWGARLAALRARHGVHVVISGVPRAALRHLDAGGCFGLLWDQHSRAPAARLGTFLGAPAALDPLPFFLLARRPAPVYFGVLLPGTCGARGGTLRLIPLLRRFDAGWEDRLARRYHRVLETLVRAQPTRWHGALHARFKAAGDYPGHREGRQNYELRVTNYELG